MLLQRSAWNEEFSTILYEDDPLPLQFYFGSLPFLLKILTVFNTSYSLNFNLTPKI